MKHVLGARQYHPQDLGELFAATDDIRLFAEGSREARRDLAESYIGLKLATVFYEPSTRTRLSFEAAGLALGMGILSTENASEFSSAIKGESVEDTTRTIAGYADIIVMRHEEEGAADKAATVSPVPVINGGDGKGEHPTQALLDMYTIQKEKGRLDNLKVVIGGDLAHGRTVRSLAHLLALYEGNEIRFVSTPALSVKEDIKDYLNVKRTPFSETPDMYAALEGADVVYWTRLQKERLADPSLQSQFVIGQLALQAMEDDTIIMHPLPRVDEIDPSVDSDPRAAYFRQAENGLYVRIALIDQLLAATQNSK